jgi:hypothetical protein
MAVGQLPNTVMVVLDEGLLVRRLRSGRSINCAGRMPCISLQRLYLRLSWQHSIASSLSEGPPSYKRLLPPTSWKQSHSDDFVEVSLARKADKPQNISCQYQIYGS